jgi:hypothetical protein
MEFNPRALLAAGAFLALLWLAVEGQSSLAGIAVDHVFGWGLLGFGAWLALARGLPLKKIQRAFGFGPKV